MNSSCAQTVLGTLLAVGLLLAGACGEADPRAQVLAARAEFSEVEIASSIPDREGGRLLIELYLEKRGKTPLDTLTLRVEQHGSEGEVLRVDHVPVDVSHYGPYEARQATLTVPLAEGDLVGLVVEVEPEPEPGITYPELEDLDAPTS